jgi:hypothetical protein
MINIFFDKELKNIPSKGCLKVDWFIVCVHACLLECLTQCRMGVASPGQVLRTCSIFNGNHSFGNHFTSIGADDVATKDLISLLVRQDLDKPFRGSIGACSRVGREWEVSFVEFNTSLHQLFLGLSNRRNLGVCVNDTLRAQQHREIKILAAPTRAIQQDKLFLPGMAL